MEVSSASLNETEIAMRADARLQEPFAVPADGELTGGEPKAILLTGATGFLGTFLLAELLRETAAEIFCLVRAASPAKGLARIERARRHYEQPGELPPGRVHAVCGDLLHPCFGLAEPDYVRLARTLDTVIHGAAAMNFYQAYETLRPANVGGTREILRFATHGRAKVLHYVSSAGVFDSPAYSGQLVRESDEPEHCAGSVTGYTQTKWVAERLVLAARERGLPATIHRPPFITGHSETGVVDGDNLIVKMMAGCIQSGVWLDEPEPVDFVPVDYVSRAVVRLLCTPGIEGRTWHYDGTRRLRWADIGLAMRANGYAMELIPYPRWKQELRQFARAPANALRPLVPLFLKVNRRLGRSVTDFYLEPPRPHFNGAATRAFLAQRGIAIPDLGDRMFGGYCDYMVRAGWAPPTPGARAAGAFVPPPARQANG
ncbi:MAG TPA: thioester reductase domain-containing protein [Opitutaceae bacterium]|nr:thioester reductase domain-containing protein [Opitutaceae bacterium]